MKKIITLVSLAMLVASFQVTAQRQAPAAIQPATDINVGIAPASVIESPVLNEGITESYWMSYAAARFVWATGQSLTPGGYYFHVFPDSTTLTCDPTCAYNGLHAIGVVIDPFSTFMKTSYGHNWNQYNSYTVDSMAIQYFYQRRSASNIVDTLIVDLYTDATTDLPTYFFTNQMATYGVDTVRWKQMLYDTLNLSKNQPRIGATSNKTVIKVPLTQTDTSRFFVGVKLFATNFFNVPAGRTVVAAALQFKPGYTYNTGDTVTSGNKNNFMFLSYEEKGGGNPGSYPTYAPGDWNCSYLIRKSERYNNGTQGWNGFYLPTWAFNQSYRLENHRVSFKLSSTFNVGTEKKSLNGVTLFQNIPNPAGNSTLLGYELDKAGSVSITITDVTGRVVMTVNEGMKSAGMHEVNLNTAELSKGMYFYTLNTDNASLTKQMVIAK